MTIGSYRHATFTAGAIAVATGLINALATPVVNTTVSGAGLNGAQAANLKLGRGPARTFKVTTSSATGAYTVGSTIVITGMRGSSVVTESFVLTLANGVDSLAGAQVFDRVTSVFIPAQTLNTGAISIGVDAVAAPGGLTFRAIKAAAAGTINCAFQDGFTDGLVAVAGALFIEPSAAERVLSSTSIGCTVYWE